GLLDLGEGPHAGVLADVRGEGLPFGLFLRAAPAVAHLHPGLESKPVDSFKLVAGHAATSDSPRYVRATTNQSSLPQRERRTPLTPCSAVCSSVAWRSCP